MRPTSLPSQTQCVIIAKHCLSPTDFSWGYLKENVYKHILNSLDKPNNKSKTSANDQLDAQIFNTFITILYMYMFRAISFSSSGGQIVLIQHLVSSLSVSDRPVHRLRKNFSSLSTCASDGHLLRVTILDAVLIQFDLLRMSKILLETCTCRGL